MDNAMRELIEEYNSNPDHVVRTTIIPMVCVTIAFTGGLLIGAILC